MLKCFTKNEENYEVKQGVNYYTYKAYIRPLDIVLFKGGDLVSDFIRYLEKRKNKVIENPISGYEVERDAFSHMGIVVDREILDDDRLDPDKLYLWESTMSGKLTDGVNNIEGESYLGVQLRDLDEVIKAYDYPKDTRIAFASLKRNIFMEDRDIIKQRFNVLFQKYNGIRYDANLYSLSSSLFKCFRKNRERVEEILGTEEWLFCSELVALIYKELGIFPPSVEPKNVVPMDFLGYEVDPVNEGGIPIVVHEPVYVVTKGTSF